MGGRGGISGRTSASSGYTLGRDVSSILDDYQKTSEMEAIWARMQDTGPDSWTARWEYQDRMMDKMDEIIQSQGFSGTPTVVSHEEMDKLISSGKGDLLWRGVSAPDQTVLDGYNRSFLRGTMFIDGDGTSYGRGIYFADSSGEAHAYAVGNSTKTSARRVDRIILREGSRTKTMTRNRYEIEEQKNPGSVSVRLAAQGYDALRITGASGNKRVRKAGGGVRQTYTIVFNRTAIITDGEDYYVK